MNKMIFLIQIRNEINICIQNWFFNKRFISIKQNIDTLVVNIIYCMMIKSDMQSTHIYVIQHS